MSLRDLVVNFQEKGFKNLDKKVDIVNEKVKGKKDFNISFKNAKDKTSSFIKTFAQVSGVITGVAGLIGYQIKKFVDDVDNMNNSLIRMGGISSETFQVLKQYGKEAGFTVEHIEGAMKKLNEESAKIGDTRDADTRLRSMMDNIASIKDPAKQSATAMKYFSETGIRMLPILTKGSKELDRYKEAMGGAILSKDQINKAQDIRNILNEINIIFLAMKNNIITGLFDDSVNGANTLKMTLEEISKLDFKPIINGIGKLISGITKFVYVATAWYDKMFGGESDVDKKERKRQKDAFEQYQFRGSRNISDEELQKLRSDKSLYINALLDFRENYNRLLKTDKTESDKLKNNLFKVAKKDKLVEENLLTLIMEEIGKASLGEEYSKFVIGGSEIKKTTKTSGTGTGTGKGTKKALPSGISAGVATESILMNFKNEFILFARKMLKFQEMAYGKPNSPYTAQASKQDVNITVQVTGDTTEGNGLGQKVANEIIKALKGVTDSNKTIVKSIENHAQIVEGLTDNNGETAMVVPGNPTPNPIT